MTAYFDKKHEEISAVRTMDLTILSGNLRRIRSAKGKSQAEVADAAGLSRVGYRNIEGGASAPRVDSLMQIASALDIRQAAEEHFGGDFRAPRTTIWT